jgi:hypothetical protein
MNDYIELTGSQWSQTTAFIMQLMDSLGYTRNTKDAENRFNRLRLRIHRPEADGKMRIDFSED